VDTAFVRVAVGVALVVASAAQVGCGSDSDSSPGDDSPPGGDPSQGSEVNGVAPADDTFLTNFCTLVRSCCGKNGRSSDIATCRAQYIENGFSQDPALQSQCLSELEGLTAAAGPSCVPEAGDLAGACSRVLYEPSGTVEPGQLCTSRADCAGAAGTITLCVVVCIRVAPGEAGEGTCLGDVSDEGVIVAAPASEPAPLPPISTGVVCERRAGLYCSLSEDNALQTCAPLRAGGATCDYSRTCASNDCYNGDTTAGDLVGTCTSLVSAGQACNLDVPTSNCDGASYCDDNGTRSGLCVAKLPGGSSCNADWQCDNDACTDGICKSTTEAQDVSLLGYCGF
jgi:hypothetical protein